MRTTHETRALYDRLTRMDLARPRNDEAAIERALMAHLQAFEMPARPVRFVDPRTGYALAEKIAKEAWRTASLQWIASFSGKPNLPGLPKGLPEKVDRGNSRFPVGVTRTMRKYKPKPTKVTHYPRPGLLERLRWTLSRFRDAWRKRGDQGEATAEKQADELWYTAVRATIAALKDPVWRMCKAGLRSQVLSRRDYYKIFRRQDNITVKILSIIHGHPWRDLSRAVATMYSPYSPDMSKAGLLDGSVWDALANPEIKAEWERHHESGVNSGEAEPMIWVFWERLSSGDDAHFVAANVGRLKRQEKEILLPLFDAYEAGLYFYWLTSSEIICVLQPAMTIENGRLHNTGGPAVVWPSGERHFFWHGVLVPDWVFETPDRIMVDVIRAEPNQEIRRCMTEIHGRDRYIRESGARLLHEDEFGRLWEAEGQVGELWRFVEVENGTPEPDGSRRTYILDVTDAAEILGWPIDTARAAVAATYGLEEDEYCPEMRT